MAKYARNDNELIQGVKKFYLKQITEKIGEDVKYLIKAYMEEVFYGMYNPIYYNRTFQLLNSVTTTKVRETANGYEIEVYLDINGIDYELEDTEYIVWLSSKGFHGSSNIYTTGEFWNDAMTELKGGYLQRKFGEYLKEKGLKVSLR